MYTKNDGHCPSVLFFITFFYYIQKHFVFLTTIRTGIEVFAEEWHYLCRVFLVGFPFHVFIQFCVELITGNFFAARAFEYAQESQNSLIGKLLLQAEGGAYSLDKILNVHSLRFDV